MGETALVKHVPSGGRQADAYQTLTEAGKNLFHKIAGRLEHLMESELQARYDVGEMLVTATANPEAYGQTVVQDVAVALGGELTQAELYQYRKFAATFTREQLSELLARRSVTGGKIAWTHLRQLIALDDEKGLAKTRELGVEAVFQQGLTVRQLADWIQEHVGAKLGGGGRLPATPKNPFVAMQQVERYREAISRRVDAWQKAIFEGLINTPPDRYNAKTLEQLRVTREGQAQLRDIAAGMVEEADVVIARMKQILEARTHQEEPGAAPSELTPGRIAAAAAAVPVRAAAKPTRPATAASPAAAGGSGDSPTAGRINNTVVGNVLKAVEAARAARKAGRA